MWFAEPEPGETLVPRRPFPLKVLLVYAAVLAVGKAGSLATWTFYETFVAPPRPLDPLTALANALVMALAASGVLGLLLRRRWALKPFIATWCAVYAAHVAGQVPFAIVSVRSWGHPIYQWLWPLHIVVIDGLLACLLVSYLCTRRVRNAALGDPAAAAQDEPTMQAEQRLPFPAKVLAIFALASGASVIAWAVPMFSVYASSGFGFRDLLLGSMQYARPVAFALLGGAGIVAALGILFRQEWGRWVFIVQTCLHGMIAIGSRLAYHSALSSRAGVPPFHALWQTGLAIAVSAMYCVFLVAYACDPSVKDAMRSDD